VVFGWCFRDWNWILEGQTQYHSNTENHMALTMYCYSQHTNCGTSTWTSFAFCAFILTCSSCCQSRNLAWHFWFKYLSCSDLFLCCSCFKASYSSLTSMALCKKSLWEALHPISCLVIWKNPNWNNFLGCDGVALDRVLCWGSISSYAHRIFLIRNGRVLHCQQWWSFEDQLTS